MRGQSKVDALLMTLRARIDAHAWIQMRAYEIQCFATAHIVAILQVVAGDPWSEMTC